MLHIMLLHAQSFSLSLMLSCLCLSVKSHLLPQRKKQKNNAVCYLASVGHQD
jgi:hypothetical protein